MDGSQCNGPGVMETVCVCVCLQSCCEDIFFFMGSFAGYLTSTSVDSASAEKHHNKSPSFRLDPERREQKRDHPKIGREIQEEITGDVHLSSKVTLR